MLSTYVCRLLSRSTRSCYTIENKIMKMQMSAKKKEHYVTYKK